MIPYFGPSVSSLAAQSQRMAVSAVNVANMRSSGVRGDRPSDPRDGYLPQRVVEVPGANGEVRAETVPVSPPSVPVFAPDDPAANEDGIAQRPNVSLEEEAVVQIQARRAYEANLRAIKAQDDMVGSLFDMIS